MARTNISQDSIIPPFLHETRPRQASVTRNPKPLRLALDHVHTSLINPSSHPSAMHLPQLGAQNAIGALPIKLFENKAPIFYTPDQLKKCFLSALKKLQYTKPTSEIDVDVLRDIFVQFGIFVTRLQLEEAYVHSTVNLGNDSDESEDEIDLKDIKRNKMRANMSMDCKDSKDKKSKFFLAKFLKWLKRNLHKLRNLKMSEIKALEEMNKPIPVQTSEEKKDATPIPAPDQRKIILAKIARDKHYWDLRTRIEQEEVFRRKTVVPHVMEMGFDDQTHLLNPESLIPKIRMQVRLDEYDKKECVYDVNRLKEMNRDIKAKLEPIVNDANEEKAGNFKAGNIMGTIIDSYKKKLVEDETNCKRYAAMARARVKQRKLEKELRTNLEMSAILQEQETAIEAARLYELMCNDKAAKELKGLKKTLTNAEERRIQQILKTKF